MKGARVALAGLEPDRLAGLARELGGGHAWYECDVTDQAALDATVSGARGRPRRPRHSGRERGMASARTAAISPPQALARIMDMKDLPAANRTSPRRRSRTCRARRGYLLFVSSAAALGALPGMAICTPRQRSPCQHFTGALRLKVAHEASGRHRLPGWIETGLMEDVVRDIPGFDELRRKLPPPSPRSPPSATAPTPSSPPSPRAGGTSTSRARSASSRRSARSCAELPRRPARPARRPRRRPADGARRRRPRPRVRGAQRRDGAAPLRRPPRRVPRAPARGSAPARPPTARRSPGPGARAAHGT